MASRGSGGSRYPSAYGHTPSYRSYNAGSSGLVGHGYPSALGTSTSSTEDKILKDFDTDKYFTDTSLSSSRAFDKYDLGMPSTTGSSAASKKVQSSSYTSNYSSSSDGGRPVVESSSDYTMKSQATGSSGIPHSSYAHSSSNYSSESPYKNRVSHHSYNI